MRVAAVREGQLEKNPIVARFGCRRARVASAPSARCRLGQGRGRAVRQSIDPDGGKHVELWTRDDLRKLSHDLDLKVQSKGKRKREIPIKPELQPPLVAVMDDRGPREPLIEEWPSLRDVARGL
jgi:hypothetical protein